nr:gliding motility protein GldM [uncultured Prevotella sp.]
MAIKKRPISPRQKMINLMYVVLMAMLALNTPSDEDLGVKGKSVVEKLKRSLSDDGSTKNASSKDKDGGLLKLDVNELGAYVIPEKTTLYAGERFNSQVVMATVDSTQRPEIYVGGSKLRSENGRYSFVASGVGEHQFGGYILFKDKNGEIMRRNFSQKYTVLPVPNSATVAADMMNVLYAGYPNPISISVPGVPANAVSATMTGGSFLSKGNGHFIATPSAVGKDVTIQVTARDKGKVRNIPPFVFHVRKLPDPTAYIAMGTERFRGGGLPKGSLMGAAGIHAAIDDGLLDIPFKVLGFETVFFDNMGNAIPLASAGSSFSERQREEFRKLPRNRRFYISHIRAVGPDGIIRNLPTAMEVIVK